jgi:amino acid adenylation domain-containing protein
MSVPHIAFDHFDNVWLERPLFDRFEDIVARHGDKTAVVDEFMQFSYRELRRACFHLAHRVQKLVPPGKPVGLLLPNGALFPVAALACLAVGRPYVPIDPSYPAMRNEEVMRDAGVAALIIDQTAQMPEIGAASLPQIDIGSSLHVTDEPRLSVVPANGPAAILYTSGSTGQPKGICHDQRAIMERIENATNVMQITSDDSVALFSSPVTIASLWVPFSALLNGATLHFADPRRLSINRVLQVLQEAGVTIAFAVPVLLRELLGSPGAKEAFRYARVIRTGGDVMLRQDLDLWRAILPSQCRIWITLASTEMPAVFQWIVPREWKADSACLPVGYARPEVKFLLADDNGTPVAAGEVGELIVKSRYLALGRWQNGQLQPFLTDPGDPSVRILHTGDLVRLRGDGLAEMVGRKDRQIKIRGFRVNLGEVEAVLRDCPGVADAAVIARRQGEEATGLVAFVAPRDSSDETLVAQLKKELAARLPAYMRPTYIRTINAIPQLPGFKPNIPELERLDAIPRLPSFKPDFKMLQSLETSISTKAAPLAQPPEAPATKLEEKVLSIGRQLLNLDDLGVSDNFFDKGGNSILLMTLMLELELQLGLEISLDTIFDHPTVREICISLSESIDSKPAVVLPIRSGSSQKTLYFTHSAFDFSALSDALTNDISTAFVTINGIKWLPQLIGGRDILAVIDRISDAYAQAIIARHQTGPCYLAGHSFGGILAVETACKLEERGAAPDIIFLFDTYLHSAMHRILYNILHNGWLARKFHEILRGDRHEIARRARFLTRNAFNRLTRSAIFVKSCTNCGEDLKLIFRDLREEASQAYRGPTRALTSHVVLFRATKTVGGRIMQIDPNLGWARHLGANLTVIMTPGDHYSLLKADHVNYVAGEIDRGLCAQEAAGEA